LQKNKLVTNNYASRIIKGQGGRRGRERGRSVGDKLEVQLVAFQAGQVWRDGFLRHPNATNSAANGARQIGVHLERRSGLGGGQLD